MCDVVGIVVVIVVVEVVKVVPAPKRLIPRAAYVVVVVKVVDVKETGSSNHAMKLL